MNWLTYFQQRRARRPVFDLPETLVLAPGLRAALAHSLQRFQLGESGDGAHLFRYAAQRSADDRAALRLFIDEEYDHASWLAQCLRALGAPQLRSHWSNDAFRRLRRGLGLHAELAVLLTAEMIAKPYYTALRDGVPQPQLAAIFGQIVRDEYGHVSFHIDRFQRAAAPLSFWHRVLLLLAWRLLHIGTTLVVIADHGAVLRACGVSRRAFWRRSHDVFFADATRALRLLPAAPCIKRRASA